MAVGASGVVLASSFWNRRAAVWGHRPVLLISLAGAVAGLLGFALTARAGLAGAVSGPLLLALLLLTRGVVFGLAWAATPVTAQSSVADVTTGVDERVRGLSMVGAPQGLALAIGALLSGFGLLAPLYVAPVLLAGIAVVLWLGLPKPPAHRAERAGDRRRDGAGDVRRRGDGRARPGAAAAGPATGAPAARGRGASP